MSEQGWAYLEDGVVVYRASSLGNCVRSLVAARMGETQFPFHASIQAAMNASSGLEDAILAAVGEQLGGDVTAGQETVELPVEAWPDGPTEPLQRCIVRGHIDGRHDDTIVEAKALSEKNFAAFEAGYAHSIEEALRRLGHLAEKYTWQAAVYGHATGRYVQFAIGQKVKVITKAHIDSVTDTSAKVTEEESHWEIGRTIVTEPIDPETLVRLTDIRARIADIEDFAARDELPECTAGCREGDPYSEAHLFASAKVGDDSLVSKLVRFEELKELLGSDKPDKDGKRHGLIGELEDIKDEVKAEYGDDRETQKVTAGPFTVSVVPNRGRERIDEKWLRANHPDIAAQATVLSKPYRTLIVKGSAKKGEQDE